MKLNKIIQTIRKIFFYLLMFYLLFSSFKYKKSVVYHKNYYEVFVRFSIVILWLHTHAIPFMFVLRESLQPEISFFFFLRNICLLYFRFGLLSHLGFTIDIKFLLFIARP